MGTQWLDDRAAWKAACAGDGNAFAVIFVRHRSWLLRSAQRVVADPSEAEDVVAMTFLELWKHRDRVRLFEGSLGPWLAVTNQNVARNVARSRRRHRSFLSRLPNVVDARSTEVLPDAEAEKFDRARQAKFILDHLSPKDAQILALSAIEELPIQAIAGVLGISIDATKQRLSRARARGRRLVDGDLTDTMQKEGVTD